MNWLAQMFGYGPKNVMVDPERRARGWTTPEEMTNAAKYDLAYGDPSAGFFQPGAAMVRQPRGLQQMRTAFNQGQMDKIGLQPIDSATANSLKAAWLAARSSPLAALGFDPRTMVVGNAKDVEGVDLSVGGAYWPGTDTIFATGKNDSTLVHESIHRGVQKLRQAGLLPEDAKNYNEESLTRAFMLKYYGDIEKGRGALADKQVDSARPMLSDRRGMKMLDALEAAAAQYAAQITPRGPR